MTANIKQEFAELSRTGKSPALLLIHGFGGSPRDVKPLVDALSSAGYAYHAILLPGHGTHPRDLKETKMSAWLERSFSAFDHLKNEYAEVSVAGFSLGGTISLVLAAERELHKLVLLSPYFAVKRRWYCWGSPESWAQRLYKIIPYVGKPWRGGPINDPVGRRKYEAYRFLPVKPIREVAALGNIARMKVKKVKCPTLWLHSQNDRVTDFQASKEVFASLPVAKKRFAEYRRSNHILLYDYDADEALNEIMSFLAADRSTEFVSSNIETITK